MASESERQVTDTRFTSSIHGCGHPFVSGVSVSEAMLAACALGVTG